MAGFGEQLLREFRIGRSIGVERTVIAGDFRCDQRAGRTGQPAHDLLVDKVPVDGGFDGLAHAEASLERLAGWACKAPAAPGPEENLTEYEPVKPLISHVNVDLAAAALTCGLARVASLEFVPGRGPFQFLDPGPNPYNGNGALGAEAISSDTRYADLARGQIAGDRSGLLKLLFHPESLEVLGVHVLGDNAAEIVHIGQSVIALGGTVEYFRDTVFNYPTYAEAYKVAAHDGLSQLPRPGV